MPEHHHFDPGDKAPSWWANAIQEFVAAADNFAVRVRPGMPTVLEVPAGPGNDQVAIGVEGRWRWATATVETAGSGSARDVDVHVVASENVFTTSGSSEVDETNYSFTLAITEINAVPSGAALSRKVGVAHWDGGQFVAVDQVAGGVLDRGQKWRPGDVKWSARKTPEPGWLLVDGSAVTGANPALRAALIADGYATNGNGDPVMPDMRGRVPMGAGQGGGLTARTLGSKVGEESHVLSVAEMPAHNHTGATGTSNQDLTHVHSGATGIENQSLQHLHTFGTNLPFSQGGWSSAALTSPGNALAEIPVAPAAIGQLDQSNIGGPPNHTHNFTTGNPSNPISNHTHNVSSQGGGQGHNVVQPSTVLNAFIKT